LEQRKEGGHQQALYALLPPVHGLARTRRGCQHTERPAFPRRDAGTLQFANIARKGATLAQIQQYFPDARDAKMLLYRIEHFAEYHSMPNNEFGEPVEGVYRTKPRNTLTEIEETVGTALMTHGPMPLPELLERIYPFGFGYESRIALVVRSIAHRTIDGEGYGLATMPAPSASCIRGELSTITGRTRT
jgi:hypothetical protein